MSTGSRPESPHSQNDSLRATTPLARMMAAPLGGIATPSVLQSQTLPADAFFSVPELPQHPGYRSASFDLTSLSDSLYPGSVHAQDFRHHSQLNAFGTPAEHLVFRQHSPRNSVYSIPSHAERQRSMSVAGASSSVRQKSQAVQPKQIRFVPNDGLPHAKRRRINAACQTCRKRKTRCSGERPVCKTCTDNGHACLGYATPAGHQQKNSTNTAGGDEDDEDSSSSAQAQGPSPSKVTKRKEHLSPDKASGSPLSVPSSRSSNASPRMTRKSPAYPAKQDSDISEGRSPASNATAASTSNRNRVPYFRYFGPTAIVPGFKQMVVSMKGSRPSYTGLGARGDSPALNWAGAPVFRTTPSITGSDGGGSFEIPFYHANEPGKISPLITHLCETFFIHLGCNYPFLQRSRFLTDLEEKRVDTILVDAVCALGARFSSHPLLVTPNEQSVEVDTNLEVHRAFRGAPFAQRAMSAVVDTFPFPTVAVVQACLLLAYEEFGANHDSGLWMYLGTSIRMAQDIGMHKLEGLRLEGRIGPTPKTAKRGSAGSSEESERAEHQKSLTRQEEEALQKEMLDEDEQDFVSTDDRRANERERIDTFYAVFFLDRVVSSGTGRPVTLRDKDIEISFPFRPDDDSMDGWPAPFPPLIRIIHLYGRVTDVLNGIKDAQEVAGDTSKRLAGMEKDLTGIYQALSPKLHFNAVNFQHYVKAEQGTNFILLHFWFHTLIVLLHQPTLLHSFGGKIQQLFPDSRELSMSSAKTIADILAFAELIDAKSFIGNPFTSQPMYIAACAFLAEMASYSSLPSTPGSTPSTTPIEGGYPQKSKHQGKTQVAPAKSKFDKKLSAKYSLLATAANQNYQRCYKALKALETYWAGTRYILTALDQKSKGIMDPVLYTNEDIESAIEVPRPIPAFSTPGWRRSVAHSQAFSYPNASQRPRHDSGNSRYSAWSPTMDPSQAIGWSLTGTMNSPNPNLSLLYSTPNIDPTQPDPLPPSQLPPFMHDQPYPGQTGNMPSYHPTDNNNMPPPSNFPSHPTDRLSDAGLLLGLHSPGGTSSAMSAPSPASFPSSFQHPSPNLQVQPPHPPPPPSNIDPSLTTRSNTNTDTSVPMNMDHPSFSDMMIESQDVDMTAQQGGFAFQNSDMMPWLEYLPQDVLSWFGDPNEVAPQQQGHGQPPLQQQQRPPLQQQQRPQK